MHLEALETLIDASLTLIKSYSCQAPKGSDTPSGQSFTGGKEGLRVTLRPPKSYLLTTAQNGPGRCRHGRASLQANSNGTESVGRTLMIQAPWFSLTMGRLPQCFMPIQVGGFQRLNFTQVSASTTFHVYTKGG